MKARAAAAVVAALAVTAPVLRAAEPPPLVWRDPTILAKGPAVPSFPLQSAPVVATGAGRTLAAWGTSAAMRGGDGRWEAPRTLGTGGLLGASIDAAGTAVVAWVENRFASNERVVAAVRPPGGTWAVADPSEGGVSCASLRMDPARGARLAWTREGRVEFTELLPDGRWSEIVDAGTLPREPEEYPQCPVLAFSEAGDVLAMWGEHRGDTGTLKWSLRHAGGAFAAAGVLASAYRINGSDLDVAFDRAGNALAVWSDAAASTAAVARASVRAAGGTFTPVETLSRPGAGGEAVALAVNRRGDAAVAWRSSTPDGGPALGVATRSPGGAWASREPAGGSWAFMKPAVAIDERGDVVVVWSEGERLIRAVVRPAGGEFGPVEDVSQVGVSVLEPSVAVDDMGNAVAGWRVKRGSANRYLWQAIPAVAARPCALSVPCPAQPPRAAGRPRPRQSPSRPTSFDRPMKKSISTSAMPIAEKRS